MLTLVNEQLIRRSRGTQSEAKQRGFTSDSQNDILAASKLILRLLP